MAFSIQTNVNSINGQENLRINGIFQSQTIQRLTSGYRINSSGDDAAGLAIANKYRSQTAELTQGVRNANDGVSALQIADGGLNNISTIVDRLRTLATQSASATFTGDRNTLNNEYQGLLTEITRQASNVGLAAGGNLNAVITTYTGGGSSAANSQVSVDLSGTGNQVDANGLGLSSSTVIGGGNNDVSGAVTDLRAGTFLAAGTENLTFQFGGSSQVVTVGNGSTAITGAQAIAQINAQIGSQGITAAIDSTNGALSFSGGSTAFTVNVAAPTAGTGIAATNANATNNALNRLQGQATFATVATGAEALAFTINGTTTNVSLAIGTTLLGAQSQINTALAGQGVSAVLSSTGNGLEFQGSNAVSVVRTGTAGATGVFAANGTLASTAPAASATATGNALLALTQLTAATAALGLVQGRVGGGQNKLQYAVNLAQSQITNLSAAQSRIRDADVAAEAANLTKAQVLEQASVAALSQANSAPQAILALLHA